MAVDSKKSPDDLSAELAQLAAARDWDSFNKKIATWTSIYEPGFLQQLLAIHGPAMADAQAWKSLLFLTVVTADFIPNPSERDTFRMQQIKTFGPKIAAAEDWISLNMLITQTVGELDDKKERVVAFAEQLEIHGPQMAAADAGDSLCVLIIRCADLIEDVAERLDFTLRQMSAYSRSMIAAKIDVPLGANEEPLSRLLGYCQTLVEEHRATEAFASLMPAARAEPQRDGTADLGKPGFK